jgi:hypothetical protein
MIRERVEYTDCLFEGMGDDAANVHGMYKMVHERPDARTIIARGWKSIFSDPKLMAGLAKDDFAAPGQYSLRPGDTLEFGTPENPLVPVFTARIVDSAPVTVRGATLRRLRLNRDLPDFVRAGSIFGSAAEAPELLWRNVTVRGGRGTGLRLKTRRALVVNCLFEDVNGSGIWITCDAEVDRESLATRDITIRDNVFRRTAAAVSSSAGRKQSYPDVHENLLIAGNRIEQAPRVALRLAAIKSGVIRDNWIECAAAEAITVRDSSGLRVERNTIVRWQP